MNGLKYIISLSLLVCCVTAIDYQKLEKQMSNELQQSKACYCILPNVLGGTSLIHFNPKIPEKVF